MAQAIRWGVEWGLMPALCWIVLVAFAFAIGDDADDYDDEFEEDIQ